MCQHHLQTPNQEPSMKLKVSEQRLRLVGLDTAANRFPDRLDAAECSEASRTENVEPSLQVKNKTVKCQEPLRAAAQAHLPLEKYLSTWKTGGTNSVMNSGPSMSRSMVQTEVVEIPTTPQGGSARELTYSLVSDADDSEIPSESTPPSPPSYENTVSVRAKHNLIAALMEEVYAMFDLRWTANVGQHAFEKARSSASSSYTEAPSRNGSADHSNRPTRRRKRNQSSGDDDHRKRRRNEKRQNEGSSEPKAQPFACPFNRYNPEKYQPTTASGSRYRSCLGPGFVSKSHVKYDLPSTHLQKR